MEGIANGLNIDFGKVVHAGTKILLCTSTKSSLCVEELSDDGSISAVKEVTNITCNAGSTIHGSEYFIISSPERNYCVYYVKDNFGVEPPMRAVVFLKVTLVTGDTAANVATKTAAIFNATGIFTATVNDATVTVTNVMPGEVFRPIDQNTMFAFNVTTKGSKKILFNSSLGNNVKQVLDINIGSDGSAEILVNAEFSRTSMDKENKLNSVFNYRPTLLTTPAGTFFTAAI